MRTIWQSLAWREWHEHKWKLVSITAVLWGVAALVLKSGFNAELHAVEMLLPLLSVCVVPLAVFVGLGSAAGERSRGTLAFTQSLPAPMWRIAVWKVILGFVTLAVPILLTVAVVYVCSLLPAMSEEHRPTLAARQRSVTGNLFADITLYSTALAASFYIWAAAFGVNRKDEVSAGAVAISVIVGWYVLLTVVWYLMVGLSPVRVTELTGETAIGVFRLMAATGAGGFTYALDFGTNRSYALLAAAGTVAILMHSLLLAKYVLYFGRATNLQVASPKAAVQDSATAPWLGQPFGSTLSAIAWKQFRESLPLIVVGLTGVAAIVLLYVVQALLNANLNSRAFLGVIVGTSLPFGFFVAVVLGIGVSLNDATPGINTFWRSRPINADAWFWTKFITGLCLLLMAEYIPLLVIVFALDEFSAKMFDQYNLLLCLVIQVAVYAGAVMTTSLVRHAVYAAILSMATVYLGAIFGLAAWYVAGLAGWVRLYPHGWMEPDDNLPVVAGMIFSAVSSTVVAWLAVRNDWGWKSRY